MASIKMQFEVPAKMKTWSLALIAVGLVGYFYKFVVAIILTPIIYLGHNLIDRYLGHEVATALKQQAMKN